MTQKQTKFYWKLRLSFSLFIGSVGVPIECVLAQLIPDRTLGTESSSIVNNGDGVNSTQIDGGASRGSNLFHSFAQFNIGEQQEVLFNSPPEIINILTRVTGGGPSEILGSLGVIGDANLFLINPNGIIFGGNASLNLQGSFVASTANSVIFANGIQYSATNPQAASLLIVNAPIGLQYGGTNSSIRLRQAKLNVNPGQTLALIGGEVSIQGSNLIASEGHLEVGSVADDGLASLNSTTQGWSFSYANVANFQNISITSFNNNQSSVLDTNGDSGGTINLQGKQILIADTSQISSITNGAGTGGNIVVNASELFLIQGLDSLLTTATTATGNGGNITVNTGKLVLEDRAVILTDSSVSEISPVDTRFAIGKAGNVTINAFISVELRNGSSVSSTTQGSGNAGNININTPSLTVQDNAGIEVSSIDTGNAGNLTISARTISLDNGGKLTATSSSGNGGNITLKKLESLVLRDQSEISTSAQGTGKGGNINIKTKLLVGLENSDITANAFGGEGGFIQIDTNGVFGLQVRQQVTENSDITAFSQKDPSLNGVVEIDRLENDPKNALLTLPTEPINIEGLIAQGCASSIARGSKFVITGRGGLPPNPQEAFRSEVALADLGKPVTEVTNRAKVVAPTNQELSEMPLVEAQEWIIGDNGSVVLTAIAPNVTPSIPWMKANSCDGS